MTFRSLCIMPNFTEDNILIRPIPTLVDAFETAEDVAVRATLYVQCELRGNAACRKGDITYGRARTVHRIQF
jgi:hypothetical protein